MFASNGGAASLRCRKEKTLATFRGCSVGESKRAHWNMVVVVRGSENTEHHNQVRKEEKIS
jgi:hypothetical protein